MYKNFKTETNFHKERIHLSSAALFQSGFHVEDTVRYIGGPHIGAHRNPDAIRKRLTAGVEPAILDRPPFGICELHIQTSSFLLMMTTSKTHFP